MFLATDEQTISDLEIFGKRKGSGIYDLYNQTHTRGGEARLKELFLHPLSDKEEINRRSNMIAHFAALNKAFPFDATVFDTAEKYLLHVGDDSKKALSEKETHQGVSAIIELLVKVKDWVEMKEVRSVDAYRKERDAMAELVSDPAFEPVLSLKDRSKLSFTAVAAFDVLFRLREAARIKELLGHVYYLDVYLSVAKLAVERKFIFPQAYDSGHSLVMEGVYHPELKNPIGNTISMDAAHNLIFLTGANMAGKSTFLRSVSTAIYIAHIGFPVAAQYMEFPVMDGIYTTINLPDNLGIGASHFYSEVLRVKKIATALHEGKSIFVVFDELFRGTNVKDAHEATVAVASAFARKKNSLFIISSHIVEAGEQLGKQPGVMFRYLPTKMKDHTPVYTYTLEEGITDDRHGMIIIRNEGILDILKKGRKAKKVQHEL